MGESTHWYQPELLGPVPSLAARELWNIFVRAGFLSGLLQIFSECTLTERITLRFQSLFPTLEAGSSSRDSNENSPLASWEDLHLLYKLKDANPGCVPDSYSLTEPHYLRIPRPYTQNTSIWWLLTETTAAVRDKGLTGSGDS